MPLLVIVPFTLHLIFPKFLKAKFLEDVMKRGELVLFLFEQDSAFHAAVFSTAGKYVLLHGIRVCFIYIHVYIYVIKRIELKLIKLRF